MKTNAYRVNWNPLDHPEFRKLSDAEIDRRLGLDGEERARMAEYRRERKAGLLALALFFLGIAAVAAMLAVAYYAHGGF